MFASRLCSMQQQLGNDFVAYLSGSIIRGLRADC
jgi:hypothetical protein